MLRRGLVVVLVLAAAGCSTPAPSLPEPTPVPAEPCDVDMLDAALANMADADGYRFRRTLEHQELQRPTNLNNPVHVWVTERSTGAYLAPDRGREEVVGGSPGGSLLGLDVAVSNGGRTWIYDRSVDTWYEWEVGMPANYADAFNVAFGGQPLAWEVVEDVEGLLGEGGCVLSTSAAGADALILSVRIDPVAVRAYAWRIEQLPAAPDEGGGIRQAMEIEYVLPDPAEFRPPATFQAAP